MIVLISRRHKKALQYKKLRHKKSSAFCFLLLNCDFRADKGILFE